MSAVANLLKNAELEYPAEILEASHRIAPAWPLDAAIAVNPWWFLRAQTFVDTAAQLSVIGDISCLMNKNFYRDCWNNEINQTHLEEASHWLKNRKTASSLLAELDKQDTESSHWYNICDFLDRHPIQRKKMLWRDELVQQISQFCALHLQYPEHLIDSNERQEDLYRSWLKVARQDKGIGVVMNAPDLHQHFAALPECPKELCHQVFSGLGTPKKFTEYAHALLLDVNGWASYLAQKVWQDSLNSTKNFLVVQILAIRLAWDWALWRHTEQQMPNQFGLLKDQFLSQFDQLENTIKQRQQEQSALWVWQTALEFSYQSNLQRLLSNGPKKVPERLPLLQAAFCIDVRSEPIRRAIEAQDEAVETLGFAGFFGLPISFKLHNSNYQRPQLPGLLAPSIDALQAASNKSSVKKIQLSHYKNRLFDCAPASFGLIEMLGILKIGSLIKSSFFPAKPEHPINSLCDNQTINLVSHGQPINLSNKADLAIGALKGMGLTTNFAPTVLIVGHGSCTANNPQASGLDCGACGGQTGEVNAKVLVQLLNDLGVRALLRQSNIDIPDTTHFTAALHNTTTDEISLFGEPLEQNCINWLKAATAKAQNQRAFSLGLNSTSAMHKQYQKRSRDWAQIRPEWGLANNAAFIIAPRNFTRGVNLQGRVFLHNYDSKSDIDFSLLEQIMTAPMIVTNWINLQYYASTTDNRVYGSGNKLLHNVVGEHLGVFEGNGGDLRIGLPMQSLHNGKHWVHTPLRLSVYIDAPKSAIDKIIKKHDLLSDLVNKAWLYIFQVTPKTNRFFRYNKGEWTEAVIHKQ